MKTILYIFAWLLYVTGCLMLMGWLLWRTFRNCTITDPKERRQAGVETMAEMYHDE